MSKLLSHPVARFISLTALVGSLADWTLFAALVSLVDDRTGGSAWATAAVLFARVAPATLFAPLAARRVDHGPLRRTLRTHEAGRVAAVLLLAALAPGGPLVVAVGLLVGLEFSAAMLASGRESLISREVPTELHTSVNTATAVASYGLLPVGAVVVQLLGPVPAILAASLAYLTVLVAYLTRWPVSPTLVAVDRSGGVAADRGSTPLGRSMLRTVLAAGIGLAPIVAMFTIAPRLADRWVGEATATAVPMSLILVGGALGFVLVNRGARDWQGLVLAGAGFGALLTPAWFVGLVVVGVGAGIAYLALQTRLQSEASDPSQFAAAFSLLKVSTIAGTLAGPALWPLLDGTVLMVVASLGSLVAASIVADPRVPLRRLARLLVRRIVVIHVVGERYVGPAVVVSNHPNAVDGVVAMAADLSLRPIARWQRLRVARAGIWLADAVVTTARTDLEPRPAWKQAAAHLEGGGRIWLAPEGGAHASSTLAAPRSGAVRMAHAAGVPIQALGIRHHGDVAGPRLREWRPWRRPEVTLCWGGVMHTVGNVANDNDRMMRTLAEASGTTWAPTVELARTVAA